MDEPSLKLSVVEWLLASDSIDLHYSRGYQFRAHDQFSTVNGTEQTREGVTARQKTVERTSDIWITQGSAMRALPTQRAWVGCEPT
jgi:hypothetical protein